MLQQTSIGVFAPGAQQVSDRLTIVHEDGWVVAYQGGDPVFRWLEHDRTGRRIAAAQLSYHGLATPGALAEALGVTTEFVRRNRQLFEAGGVDAFRVRRGRPRRPHKLVGSTKAQAQRCLTQGKSMRATAEAVGVAPETIRKAVQDGRLRRPESKAKTGAPLSAPAERAATDQDGAGGVAVKRTGERALAATGVLPEAPPRFEGASAVPGAGALLALPAVLEQGLLHTAEQVFTPLRPGFYGLQSLLLTLVLMALLRIKSIEQLASVAPGELGLLLGLDRAPEVKTVRRRLAELGQQEAGRRWQEALTRHWIEKTPETLGWLYVDGHVRVYHGRAHKLPKHHVARLGRLMPGTQDFHVHDGQAQPLFQITAEATESLQAMLDTELLPRIRQWLGPERRVLVVFDRGGWSPAAFRRWHADGFDVLTYRKGAQTPWPEADFAEHEALRDGARVNYRLTEQPAELAGGLAVREIRRLCDSGHQTAFVTTDHATSAFELACRLFGRWRQENFFKYMRQDYALDDLCTQAVEPADAERPVTNPERTRLDKEWKASRARRDRLTGYQLAIDEPWGTITVDGRRWTEEEIVDALKAAEEETERLDRERRALPRTVPLREVIDPDEVVRLEPKRKRLTDAVKMLAYRDESDLARLVEPFLARHRDEARTFLETVFQATADLVPDQAARTLTVRFHGMPTPRATRALHALCAVVNYHPVHYPGTDLTLRFEAPEGHIE